MELVQIYFKHFSTITIISNFFYYLKFFPLGSGSRKENKAEPWGFGSTALKMPKHVFFCLYFVFVVIGYGIVLYNTVIGNIFLCFRISCRCSWGSPADPWDFRAPHTRKNHRNPKNKVNSSCFHQKWYTPLPYWPVLWIRIRMDPELLLGSGITLPDPAKNERADFIS